MTGAQYHLSQRIRVDAPPGEAFELFTPRGETRWVPGWAPRFPHPAPDDSAPGTVFETDADGRVTTWVVVDREPGRRITYARVTPGVRAGTVTVAVDDAGGRRSDVTVTYALTALGRDGEHDLRQFADGYPAFIQSWRQAITAALL